MFNKNINSKIFLCYLLIFLFLTLKGWSAPFKSVAVISFSNLTGSEEHNWVAEAFTDALTRKLSYPVDIKVMDRTTLMSFKGVPDISNKMISDKKARAIAKDIHNDYLIFGSVQAAGILKNKNAPLRVHARLVDTYRGIIHKAIIADGKLSNIYDLQYRMTRKLLENIEINLSVAEINAMKQVETLQLDAYRLYNLGKIEQRKKNYVKAIEYFEQAMSKHTGILYADAHYEFGQCYLKMGRASELLVRFKKDAATLSPIYYDLGVAYKHVGDYSKAVEAFKTFVEYNDVKAILWRRKLNNDFDIMSLNGSPYVVLKEKHSVLCVEGSSGEIIWRKNVNLESIGADFLNTDSYYIKGSGNIQKISLKDGSVELVKLIPDYVQKKTEKIDLKIVFNNKDVEVHNSSSGNFIWNYTVKKDEEMIAYNKNALILRQGKFEIKAVRIQREGRPTDIDGLILLTECLLADGKEKEADEVFEYISNQIGIDNERYLQAYDNRKKQTKD